MQEADNKKQFRLIDLPKDQLKQIRYMFEKKRIPFFKNLLVQLMKRTRQLPTQLTKLFGSYISGEMAPVSWEIFLQVLEEEINFTESKNDSLDYSGKTIYLKPPIIRDLSAQPTKFFHAQYSLDFCEFIELNGTKVVIMVVNHSTLALLNDNFTEVLSSVTFSRDFQKHAQGQLHKKKVEGERLRKEQSMKKLRMSRLSSFMVDSDKEDEVEAIKYDFDVILYAGLKKQKKKRRRKKKAKKGYDNSIITDFDVEDDLMTSFDSDFSKTNSRSRRKSYRSKMGTDESFTETIRSHISSRNILVSSKEKKSSKNVFYEAIRKVTKKAINGMNINSYDNAAFHSHQTTPKSNSSKTKSQLGRSNSKRFRAAGGSRETRSKLPSINNSTKSRNHRYKVQIQKSNTSNYSRKFRKRPSIYGGGHGRNTSHNRRMSRSFLLQGSTEKNAIRRLVIDLKSKLKKGDENRQRMLYSEKEKKEIKKTFEKFKVIVDLSNQNNSTRASKSVIHNRQNRSRQVKNSKSLKPKSKIDEQEDSDFAKLEYKNFDDYKKQLDMIIQKNKANRLWKQIGNFT